MTARILEHESTRSVLLALCIVAVLLIAFGGWQFLDASLRIQDNPAYQAQMSDEAISLESEVQAQGLLAAGLEYRRLLAQRNTALMIGGAGLALLALGWIGYDMIRSYRRRTVSENAPFGGPGSR